MITRTLTLAATLSALAIGPLMAQAVTLPPDPDGNGTWSAEELRAVVPDLTDEGFAAIDADGDGEVNPDELQAGVAAGLIMLPN
ncbi:MAG: EF-hand domain-containing protein [Paracoccaceae bacterium]|nr:MAG: EF-hand domain-containing protein [Paracoccaceae bacterium]